MKTKLLFATSAGLMILGLLLSANVSSAQTRATSVDWLQKGLISIPPISAGEITYRMTADYFNRDLEGHFLNKTRVAGSCTYLFPQGKVTWNNCSISTSSGINAPFPVGQTLDYLDNFAYVPGDQMAEAAGFPGWPADSHHAKNLVWDMLAFDAFGLVYLDSLILSEKFTPHAINTKISLAGEGSFENRNSTIRWMGVTTLNETPCALIEYRQMDGNVEIDASAMKMKGRSNYWGTIWVSLLNRRIEYAEMTENVIMKITFPGQEQGQWFDTLREIVVEKVK